MSPWPSLFSSRAPKPAPEFGFAIVGLGHGAEKFLDALKDSPTVGVTSLVSNDPAKAVRLARKHRIPSAYTYADFNRIADDPAIHAVYLALPNSLHLEFTHRATIAGKHILCEKPMASSIDDGRAMIEACRRAGQLLMIGYRHLFDPIYIRAREILHANSLGAIQSVQSGFGYIAKPGWRLDPALAGGGSLFDVGIYSINALYDLFPDQLSITSSSIHRDPATNLELSADWRATLPSNANILCHSSYLKKIPDHITIRGTLGSLTLQPAFAYAGAHLHAEYPDPVSGKRVTLKLSPPRDAVSTFRLEAEHLAHCALTGDPVLTPGELGLRDLQTIARICALRHAAPPTC